MDDNDWKLRIDRALFDDFWTPEDFDAAYPLAKDEYRTAENLSESRLGSEAWKRPIAKMVENFFHSQMGFLSSAVGRCESPIEEAFLAGLVGSYVGIDGLRFSRAVVKCFPDAFDVLVVVPQAQLGPHRVDFLLQKFEAMPDRMTASIAVECDGHEFHERTKDQARRDKGRDRAIQALRIPVVRFTGSELWMNPVKCAEEAIHVLNSNLRVF